MYDRVLYDKIVNGIPLPNGIDNDKVIELFVNNKKWKKYSFLSKEPIFSSDQIALTHNSESGVYPICIREPSILNSYIINTLILNAGERTLSLIKNGAVKLCWFIDQEPLKHVDQVIEIYKCMAEWDIKNFNIFTNLPFSDVKQPPAKESTHCPSTSHELEAMKNLKPKNTSEIDYIRSPKRFFLLSYGNLYDWRLLTLNFLERAKVLDNTNYSVNLTAPLIKTNSITDESLNTHLDKHQKIIRADLALNSYRYLLEKDVTANSQFCIVLEAYLNYDTVVDHTYITEKTFKPIYMGHPFVIFGQPHSLSWLHERGYRTFHPHIDESYDRIDNDLLRLKTLIAEIVRINSLSKSHFDSLLKKVAPIVQHNSMRMQQNISNFRTKIFAHAK